MKNLTKTEKYTIGGAIVLVIIAVIVGFALGRGKAPGFGNPAGFARWDGSGPGQMQIGGNKRPNFGGNGALGGEIISKDTNSLKIQLNNGGSRLVRLSETTQVQKTIDGSLDDLTVGASINISGQTNSDGSLSAKTIQIRSAVPMGAGSGR